MTRTVLFHVQHLLGIGHLQRALRVAEALVEDGVAVTLVSGGMPAALPIPAAIRLVQLEPVRALDARFALVDRRGLAIDGPLRERRRDALLAAFAETRPDAVVIEGFPFARRAFRFELDPLIAAARLARWRPPVVCSLRDIVVLRDDPERHRAIVDRVRRDFARVLVHGDPALIALDASFPEAPTIADQITYTGYVTTPGAAVNHEGDDGGDAGTGEVIVSAGGGGAGRALLAAALAARRAGCLTHMRWRLLAGNNLPAADFLALREAAPADVAVERFREDFPVLLRRCAVSVSQAGYNTVLDVMAANARAVLVPFAAERETEQPLRAARLAALGAAEIVAENMLSPAALAAAIERAAARPAAPIAVDTEGARRSAREIAALIASSRAASWAFVANESAGMLNP